MDRSLNYALSLFGALPDRDKEQIIALMLSFLSLQEPSSAQTE